MYCRTHWMPIGKRERLSGFSLREGGEKESVEVCGRARGGGKGVLRKGRLS